MTDDQISTTDSVEEQAFGYPYLVGSTKINVAISQASNARMCNQFVLTYKRRTIPLPHILWRGMIQ